MNVIEEQITKAIDDELAAATERFGLHHSWHEKYAVMLEEMEELEEEVMWAKEYLTSVWFGVKHNQEDYAEANIPDVYEHAVKAACEAIQVAAMAKKEIAEQDDRRPTATKHTAMSGSNGYITYTCGVCGKHVGRDVRYCGNCGAYFGE